ncbi:MAG TPA: hypothetical protein VM509_03425, partial [Planctomycetota bacterium]|nr:hypothetical protein [Planctomycetota bacterium]
VAWGRNDQGQCTVPVLPAGSRYTRIAAGEAHTQSGVSDGSAVSWGRDSEGQCELPALPPGLSFVELCAGKHSGVARIDVSCSIDPPLSYCTAKTNSLGCVPATSASGSPSASATSGFVIRATNLRNNKPGFLLYTKGGRGAIPFQGGYLCIGAPIKISTPLHSGGSAYPMNDCSGVWSLDMNAFAAGALGGIPAPYLRIVGTVIDAQFWGRDNILPWVSNSALTDGLEFVVCF